MNADDIAVGDAPLDPVEPIHIIDAFEILAGYERRSLAHVAGLPEQLQAAGLWRGIGFRVGQRRLVSNYESVAEIITVPQITPVPGAQSWMLGVANVRSNLLPVVDLKQFLEGARSVLHEGHQKVMVLRQPGGDVAVTIDELYGQRSFMDEQQVDVATLADGRYTGFIERAYRVADDVWGVFSLDRLVRTPEFRHAAV
jgi:twitching motility protein PilI